MSVLAPQGWPERVWALVKLLNTAGRPMTIVEVASWLTPQDVEIPDALKETISASRSLGFISGDEDALVANCKCENRGAFADSVHARLAETEEDHPDFVVIEVLAWVVARNLREESQSWIRMGTIESLVDLMAQELWPKDIGARRFNKTKWTAWVRWVEFVRVAEKFPPQDVRLHISLYERLRREISTVGKQLGTEKPLPARTFVSALAARMPYVDGGTAFASVAQRLGYTPSDHLSPNLSDALRELHLDQIIDIDAPNDASNPVRLARNDLQPGPGYMDSVTIRERAL